MKLYLTFYYLVTLVIGTLISSGFPSKLMEFGYGDSSYIQSTDSINDQDGYHRAFKIIEESPEDYVLQRLKSYFASLDENGSDQKNKLRVLDALSEYWYLKGDHEIALKYIQLAEEQGLISTDSYSVDLLIKLAKTQFAFSQHDKSLKTALTALQLSENNEYPFGIINALINIGNNYWYIGDLKSAESNYLKALEVARSHKSFRLNEAMLLGNLALLKRTQGDNSQSELFHIQSLEIFRELDNKYHLSIGLQNYGVLLEEMGRFDEAIAASKEAKKYAIDLEIKRGIISTYNNLASNYKHKNQLQVAAKYLDSALMVSKQSDYLFGNQEVYDLYSKVLAEQNNYAKAYAMRLEYEKWKDSISFLDQQKKIKELDAKYLAKEKENEILELSKENLTKDRTIKLVSVIGIFIVMTLLGALYLFKQHSKFREQEAVFKAMVKTELREQHRIARDLHDSIGTMLASLKGYFSLIRTKDSESKKMLIKSTGILKRTIDETRRISHNMMPEELVKFGLVAAVESLLDEVESATDMKTTFEHYNICDKMEISKELHIYRITQELVQNIIKHSSSKSIFVQLKDENNQMVLKVQDSGKGFNLTEASEAGFGLKNIQSRVDFLNGKLAIDSKPNMGTIISLNIPAT